MKTEADIIDSATNDLVRYFQIMHPLSDLDKQYIRVIIQSTYMEGQFKQIQKELEKIKKA